MLTISQLKSALHATVKADIPTMIWGPSGVGKSDGVRQLVRELSTPKEKWGYIDFRPTLRDPVDLRGLPMTDTRTNTTRWLAPDELPQEKRDGKFGILCIEELPQAVMSMQNACFSLVLDRYVGEYKFPPGWRIVATGNRLVDRAGTTRMNKALANRFAHVEVGADLNAWCEWATQKHIDLEPLVVAFLRFRPEFLHKMPEGEENAFPTPRAWASVSKIAMEPDNTLRLNLVQSLVGEAAAREFEGFVRVWKALPSIDTIFRDPDAAHMPGAQEPATLYALASGLARRVDAKTATNAMKYAKRFPSREFEILFAHDAVKRNPTIKETRAFGDWFARNSEVVT